MSVNFLSSRPVICSDADFAFIEDHANKNHCMYNPKNWYHIIQNGKSKIFSGFCHESLDLIFYKTTRRCYQQQEKNHHLD